MAPNSPACSFIHASMAGFRSTAPLNRSNSVLIVALFSAPEMYGHVAFHRSLEAQPDPDLGREWDANRRPRAKKVAQCAGRHAQLIQAGNRLRLRTIRIQAKRR